MSFKLEQTETGFALVITPDTLCVGSADDAYSIAFQSGADTVNLKLSPDLLNILSQQCLAHLPQTTLQLAEPGIEDSYRQIAAFIKTLDDRSLQALLRECNSDTVACFLWYMKDGELIRQVFSNMSQRAAEMLMDLLEQQWSQRKPDDPSSPWVQRGRATTLRVLGLARRLANERLIETIPPALTQEEIDALLKGLTGHDSK